MIQIPLNHPNLVSVIPEVGTLTLVISLNPIKENEASNHSGVLVVLRGIENKGVVLSEMTLIH